MAKAVHWVQQREEKTPGQGLQPWAAQGGAAGRAGEKPLKIVFTQSRRWPRHFLLIFCSAGDNCSNYYFLTTLITWKTKKRNANR